MPRMSAGLDVAGEGHAAQAACARRRAKRVSVLGATGSVGQNTLDLIGRNPGMFEVVALTANRNAKQLAELAVRHGAALAVVADDEPLRRAEGAPRRHRHRGGRRRRRADRGGDAAGRLRDGRDHRCGRTAPDAGGGIARDAGSRSPTRNAWCAPGEMFMAAVREAGTELVPVDSEHSAVFQAIAGADPAAIERIVLTASGGPFRTWSLRAAGARHAGAGAHASQLVDGAQDHHQLRHPDEQGPGADRGLPPVSGRAGPARGGRASPVDHPRAGRLPRRLDAGAAGQPRHAHADCR